MALTGILRPGLIQLRVTDLEKSVEHYVERIGLDEVGRDGGLVYLKGWDEFDHHSVVLRKAETAGMDFFAFKVDSDETLEHYRKRIEDAGVEVTDVAAGDQPGFGPRIAFKIPTGHRIELYAQVER
ncbi:MAG: VOC family protein, partial [Methylocystaceae bacterium]|nr:VOC family protein [Methylocystaceae bacterium]